MRRFLILGAGYSACAFAQIYLAGRIPVAGTTRSIANFARLEACGMEPLFFDGSGLLLEVEKALCVTTHLIVSLPSGTHATEPIPEALYKAVLSNMPSLCAIFYLSSTGVYGDHEGAEVDEDSQLRAVSKERINGEQAWQNLGRLRGCAVTILRLSGIYGPGRNVFRSFSAGSAVRIIKPGHVFNRIQVADIAGALWHLAINHHEGIFNVSDDEPASSSDVISFAARISGFPLPPEVLFENASLSERLCGFYESSRRVSARRLKNTGYRLLYSTYREGLTALWEQEKSMP